MGQSDLEGALGTADCAGVPYHTIVANLFPDAPPGLWTDGVVAYESTHLDGAESEIMVRHNHFVNDTTEATLEVQRILRLHLGALSSERLTARDGLHYQVIPSTGRPEGRTARPLARRQSRVFRRLGCGQIECSGSRRQMNSILSR